METIDLKKFCGYQEQLETPFWRKGFLYASDGVVCVRIPAEENPSFEHKRVPKAEELPHWWTDDAFFQWSPLPELPPVEYENCDDCGGSGQDWRQLRDCPKCGNCDWPCENCDGSGQTKKITRVSIGGFDFNNFKLALLESLPNGSVSVSSYPNSKDGKDAGILRVRFDGGQGLVMGMNKESESASVKAAIAAASGAAKEEGRGE